MHHPLLDISLESANAQLSALKRPGPNNVSLIYFSATFLPPIILKGPGPFLNYAECVKRELAASLHDQLASVPRTVEL